MLLSAVIPVYNEVDSLQSLYDQLVLMAESETFDLEIVFVDDGSRDGSWEVVERMAAADIRVHGIRFRRNFGKAAALNAGFAEAQGEIVVTLDADLQDDPAEIPRFVEQIEQGFAVVSGWKKVRHDPWHKVLPSRVFNYMVSKLTGVHLHDHNCGLKCYRREVLGEVRLYGELHRFIPVLADARGFQVGELVIQHRPRQHGHSKYGVGRFIKGFLDLLTVKFLTGFGQRPLHFLGSLGLVFFLIGSLGLSLMAFDWTANWLWPSADHIPLHQRPVVLYSVAAMLLGGQLLSIGIVAELITSYQGRDRDSYSITQRTAPAVSNQTRAHNESSL